MRSDIMCTVSGRKEILLKINSSLATNCFVISLAVDLFKTSWTGWKFR